MQHCALTSRLARFLFVEYRMMRQYELVERVQKYKPDANEALLNKAYVYAMQKHGQQKRANGDPYISHPLEVAAILTEKHVEVDEPEPDPVTLAASAVADGEDEDLPETINFDQMSEEELLAGIEGLVPPEKNDDY